MVGELEQLRVLVVDDEPNIVDVVSMALRHNGFDVEAAGTGSGALSKVREWRPHVMVLDVMLPDMDGFEVARRLTTDRAGVPILVLSARDATSDKVRGLTTGGDDYVTKPFSLEELIARVLETYVSYLRKKLDVHGPSLIQTVRGVGYALRPPRT